MTRPAAGWRGGGTKKKGMEQGNHAETARKYLALEVSLFVVAITPGARTQVKDVLIVVAAIALVDGNAAGFPALSA